MCCFSVLTCIPSSQLAALGRDAPWGDYDHNNKLKRHLETRGEQTEGTKADLIQHLKIW